MDLTVSTTGSLLGKDSRCVFARKINFAFLTTNYNNMLFPTATLNNFLQDLTSQ